MAKKTLKQLADEATKKATDARITAVDLVKAAEGKPEDSDEAKSAKEAVEAAADAAEFAADLTAAAETAEKAAAKAAKNQASNSAANDSEADPAPTKSELNMERQLERQEKTLRQQLDDMPKVSIEIPEDPNNPDDVVPVGWNGIIYAIPRGRQFQVPQAIYEIWKESHTKTQAINKRIRDSVEKEIKVIE